MVGPVLRIIFEDEDGRVIPVGAVGDGIDDASYCEIIVGDRSGGARLALGAAGSVIVWQAQEKELGHPVQVFSTQGNEAVEFVQKFVGAKLIGIRNLKVGEPRIEVAAEFFLRGDVFCQDRNVPWIGTGSTTRGTDILFERFSFLDDRALAFSSRNHGRPCGDDVANIAMAPLGNDVLVVVAIGDAVRREILPKIAAGGLASVGQIIAGRDSAEELAFGVVGVLLAAVANRPRFFDVIGDGSGCGPDVAVAGNVTGIVEVIENAELAGEFVFIGSDFFAIEGD